MRRWSLREGLRDGSGWSEEEWSGEDWISRTCQTWSRTLGFGSGVDMVGSTLGPQPRLGSKEVSTGPTGWS